jgi:hypothetical protein
MVKNTAFYGNGDGTNPKGQLNNAVKYQNNFRTQQSIFSARFYCALLTTCFGPVWRPSSGGFSNTKNIQGSHYIFNGSFE